MEFLPIFRVQRAALDWQASDVPGFLLIGTGL
jgi:hypothetical protein